MRLCWVFILLCACEDSQEAKPIESTTSAMLARKSAPPVVSSIPKAETISNDRPPPYGQWAEAPSVSASSVPERCEVRSLAPWLRVACGGASAVEVERGGGDGKTYAIRSPDEAALVLRFVEGVKVRATFKWSDAKRHVDVAWPKGRERPTHAAAFSEP